MNIKKISLFIIAIICWFIISIYLFFTDPRIGGKDTVVSFGDGTYQILKAFDGNEIIYDFCNVVTNEVVINIIYEYKVDEKKNIVYVIGKNQSKDTAYKYIVLNYKTGKSIRYDSLEKMEENIKKVFQKSKFMKL